MFVVLFPNVVGSGVPSWKVSCPIKCLISTRFFNNVANENLISYEPCPDFHLIETDLSKRISVAVSVFSNSLLGFSK